MSYLIGATAMLFFFICIGSTAIIAYKLGKKHKAIETIDEKTKQALEKKQKAWDSLMSYDLNKAMGRK